MESTSRRAVGIRQAVIAATYLQTADLDRGLFMGERAITVLAKVRSARAHGYVNSVTTALAPWRREPRVNEFVQRSRQVIDLST